jgi:hypothetical protein
MPFLPPILNGKKQKSLRFNPFQETNLPDQIPTALTALKKSKFRSRFKLTDKDCQYIHTNGIETIRSHAVDFITSRLAPAFPKNDGKQTPMRGHPVFVAQHATAICCLSFAPKERK